MLLNILTNYRGAILRGIGDTLKICFSSWILGISLGIILGYIAQRQEAIAKFLSASAFLLFSIPVLVLLFWLHYPAQAFLKITIHPIITTIATLTIINAILIAELVKKTVDNFPVQYVLAAKVCGLNDRKIFFKIKFPIMLRQILPSLCSQQVLIMHMSLFGSLISVEEIFRVSQQINSQVYRPIEIYTALALLFIAVSLPLNLIAHYLKNKYTRDLSEK